jgi:hypothetical protein
MVRDLQPGVQIITVECVAGAGIMTIKVCKDA